MIYCWCNFFSRPVSFRGFLFCFTPKGFGQIMEFLKFCDSLQTNVDCAIWCYSSVRPLYLAFVSSPVELSTIRFCIKFLPFLLNSLESPSKRTKSIFNVVFLSLPVFECTSINISPTLLRNAAIKPCWT